MSIYNKLFLDFKDSYMLMIPLSIILQSCLGSITTMYILLNSDSFLLVSMTLSVSTCMVYNAAILAQLKPKIVFNLLLISVTINVLLLLINV